MKQFIQIILGIFAVVSPIHFVNGERILGIYHYPSKSHHILGSTLLKELAARGHHVTMLSPYPLENPPPNYVDIPLPELLEYKKDLDMFELSRGGFLERSSKLYRNILMATNITLHSEGVQQLLKNPHSQFDLVIIECFMNEALLGIAHHFKAPVISMSTSGALSINTYITDNPVPYAYVPSLDLGFSGRMTFLERVGNTLTSFLGDLIVRYVMPWEQNYIMMQVFPDAPHVKELTKNVSLVLLNSHYSIETPRPFVPQMVQIGGFHVKKPKKLSEDLQEFLDSAKDGVVFFSLGSNLKSSNLPTEKLKEILATFSKLKQKVLIKWEDEQLEGKPDNVKIGKWLPQNDILAHPNVKLFITHGGLLSTIEAVYHRVPLIGIPFFGDQKSNVHISAKDGYAVVLDFDDLTEISLRNAINEVLSTPKYAETIKLKSALIKDQPVKPLDNAVFWVEHIMRHKGGAHLRTAAQHLSWAQLLLLDVLAFLLFCGTLTCYITYLIYKLFCKCVCKFVPKNGGKRKLKRN